MLINDIPANHSSHAGMVQMFFQSTAWQGERSPLPWWGFKGQLVGTLWSLSSAALNQTAKLWNGFFIFFLHTKRTVCFALLFLHLSHIRRDPVSLSSMERRCDHSDQWSIISVPQKNLNIFADHVHLLAYFSKQISIIMQHLVRPVLQINTDLGGGRILLTLGIPRATGQWAFYLAVRCSKR